MSNKKCRLCCSGDGVVDVFNPELENVDTLISYILLATGIDIRKEDRVPTTICNRCRDITEKFHNYRLNAIILDKKLKLNCGQRYERPFTKIEELKKAALHLYFKDEIVNDQVKDVSSMSKSESDDIKDETRGRKRTVFDSDSEDEVYIRKRYRRSRKVISETFSEDDCITFSNIDSSNHFDCKYDLRVRKKIRNRSKGKNMKKRCINKRNMRASTRNDSEVSKIQEKNSAMPLYRHLLDSETDSDFPYSTRLLNPNTRPLIDSDSDGQLFSLNYQKKIKSNKDQVLKTCTKNTIVSVPSQNSLPLNRPEFKSTLPTTTFRKTDDIGSCSLNPTIIDYKPLNENCVNKKVKTSSSQEKTENLKQQVSEKMNFLKKTQQEYDVSPCLFSPENSVHYSSSETMSQSLLDTRFLNLQPFKKTLNSNSQKRVENVKNCASKLNKKNLAHAKLKNEFKKHFIYLDSDSTDYLDLENDNDIEIIDKIQDNEDSDERLFDNKKTINPILTSNLDNLILEKKENLNQSVNKDISNSDIFIIDRESTLPESPIEILDDEDEDIKFDSQKTGSVISTLNKPLKHNFNFENFFNNFDLNPKVDRVKRDSGVELLKDVNSSDSRTTTISTKVPSYINHNVYLPNLAETANKLSITLSALMQENS